MSRRLAAAAACAALLAAAAPASAARPEDLALRLADVGAGYVIPDDECLPTTLHGDGTSRVVDQIARLRHRGCEIAFQRLWVAPGAPAGPREVSSRALVFDDPAGPQTALTRPRAVASFMYLPTREELEVIEPAPAIGDEAVLLRAPETSFRGATWWDAIVLWRSGNVLATVEAIGTESADATAQAALRLAAAQQARIAAPTPLAPADLDDLEVPLDDPRIEGPVEVEQPTRADVRLGLRTSLHYGRDVGSGTAITVMTVEPSLLRKPGPRRELRRIRRARCTVVDRLRLPAGRAAIFTGAARCPHYGDTFALVRLPGALVTVIPDGCQVCRGPVSRYRTRAGLKTLVRALVRRQPATSPATP